MRPIWFVYIVLGIGFVFCVYMTTLGSMQWWYIVYYIILGFLGIMGIWYARMRWSFIFGVILGIVLLILLYKYEYLDLNTRLFFLQRFIR